MTTFSSSAIASELTCEYGTDAMVDLLAAPVPPQNVDVGAVTEHHAFFPPGFGVSMSRSSSLPRSSGGDRLVLNRESRPDLHPTSTTHPR